MAQMTQEELSNKYGVSKAFVSTALREVVPASKRQGAKRILNVYDEKEAVTAILRDLKESAEKKHAIFKEADDRYRNAERIANANGLIDNPRWRL